MPDALLRSVESLRKRGMQMLQIRPPECDNDRRSSRVRFYWLTIYPGDKMSEQEDLQKALLKVTAKSIALEKLLLAVISQSADKIKILKAFEEEMEQGVTRTLFESELKDYPESELPAAYDNLFVQVTALCG
jgi:hypothetical protein